MNRKDGLIHERSDDVNPPPLSPGTPTYTMNIPCIHSSMPNDEERMVLLSLVSRVGKNDEVMKDIAITDPDVVSKDDANSNLTVVTSDEFISFGDFENPLTPESNIPCMHSIIGKVNEEFQFWSDISK